MANFDAAFSKIFEHETGYGYKKKPYRKDVYVIDNCFPVDFSKYHYADFRTAFEKSVSFEGGYVSPEYAAKVKDAGGETYMGISRNSNPDWPGWKIIDAVKKQRKLKWNEKINDPKLTALVYDRAKKRYWDVIRGDEINNQQVAELIFELFWASGGLGIKQAQAALNKVISPPSSPIKVDGVFGGDTLNKINAAPQSQLYSAIYNERKRFSARSEALGSAAAATQTLISQTATAVVLMIGLIKLSPQVTLSAVGLFALAAIPLRAADSRARHSGHTLGVEWQRITERLLSSARNLLLLQILGTQTSERQSARGHLHEYRRHVLVYYTVSGLKVALPQILGLILICVIATTAQKTSALMPGTLVTYFYLFLRLVQVAAGASQSGTTLAHLTPQVDEVLAWSLRQDEEIPPANADPRPVAKVGFHLRAASFAYFRNKP
jgi:lysozyme family protein